MSQPYPTDLTDTEWTILTPFIPAAKPGGRPRTTDLREVVNAIFYVLRGGCGIVKLLRMSPPQGEQGLPGAPYRPCLPLCSPLRTRDFGPTREAVPHLLTVLRRRQPMASRAEVLGNRSL